MRPKARRIGRSLAGAEWDRAFGLDGCRLRRGWRIPGAKVRGASGRGLPGRPSRQRGALALGFVAGALGKPYASAQVGRVKPKPDFGRFFAYFARSRWRLLPSFFSALSRNFFSELLDLQPLETYRPRCACQCSRAYRSAFFFPLSADFSFCCLIFIRNRYSSRTKGID